VWLRRSLGLALAAAFTAGCFGSDPKTYNAQEVADALRNRGFQVEIRPYTGQEFQRVFPQAPEGVLSIVAGLERIIRRPPLWRAGSGSLLVAAFIFETQEKASCGDSNVIGTCLRKRNVVVVVRKSRAEGARAALDDLD